MASARVVRESEVAQPQPQPQPQQPQPQPQEAATEWARNPVEYRHHAAEAAAEAEVHYSPGDVVSEYRKRRTFLGNTWAGWGQIVLAFGGLYALIAALWALLYYIAYWVRGSNFLSLPEPS